MPRKNKRVKDDDAFLALIKEESEWRPVPRCPRFPYKTVFTSGFRAQMSIDDIKAHADSDYTPERVYECETQYGGCGFYHVTSMKELPEEA